jgi:hypothetical protein
MRGYSTSTIYHCTTSYITFSLVEDLQLKPDNLTDAVIWLPINCEARVDVVKRHQARCTIFTPRKFYNMVLCKVPCQWTSQCTLQYYILNANYTLCVGSILTNWVITWSTRFEFIVHLHSNVNDQFSARFGPTRKIHVTTASHIYFRIKKLPIVHQMRAYLMNIYDVVSTLVMFQHLALTTRNEYYDF